MVRKSSQVSQREQNETRMRRAKSWQNRSEETSFDDEKFLFLWIAFNAAYGTDLSDTSDDDRVTERDRFANFVNKIVEKDHERAIEKTLWDTFSGPVRVLLKNRFVFGPFWNWVQDRPEGKDWKSKFNKRNQQVLEALGKHDVSSVLEEVLARLYILRNQIIHGGTTFAEGWGRDQIKDGSRIMAVLMPEILEIMQDDINKNPESGVWGELNYPRVGDPENPE